MGRFIKSDTANTGWLFKLLSGIFLAAYFISCVPITEKENCERWGCSDTDNEWLTVMCPGAVELSNLDCRNFSPRYKSEAECIQKKNSDRDSYLVSCSVGIRTEKILTKNPTFLSAEAGVFSTADFMKISA